MNAQMFRRLALSFPDALEVVHMDRAGFRTTRRMFATLAPDNASANVKLSPKDQNRYCDEHEGAVAPVSGGWGRMGWTTLVLRSLSATVVKPIVIAAHALAAPPPKKVAAVKPRKRKS